MTALYFLWFNHRKYKGKLLIKPSKPNVLLFLSDLRELIKNHKTLPVNDLIKMMNPKLCGWANYYRHSVAKRTFNYISHRLFEMLWSWAKRRHPTKGKRWVAIKYFINRKGQWQFHGWHKIANMDCQFNLVQIARTPIKRHVKIRSNATPYNPEFAGYLEKRKQPKRCRNSWSEPVTAMF